MSGSDPQLRRHHAVYTAADRDGAVLLHSTQNRLYGLNPSAAALWERLTSGEDPDSVISDLSGLWGVSEERLRGDVRGLTDTLVRLGLAVPEGGSR
ncbi:PqqD family protein [Nocardiopsis sp. NPDC055824]